MCYLWWKKVKNRKIHNKKRRKTQNENAEKFKMKVPKNLKYACEKA